MSSRYCFLCKKKSDDLHFVSRTKYKRREKLAFLIVPSDLYRDTVARIEKSLEEDGRPCICNAHFSSTLQNTQVALYPTVTIVRRNEEQHEKNKNRWKTRLPTMTTLSLRETSLRGTSSSPSRPFVRRSSSLGRPSLVSPVLLRRLHSSLPSRPRRGPIGGSSRCL